MPQGTELLKWAKLSEAGRAPERKSDESAGYDLRSAHRAAVPAHGKVVVKTDIQILVPEGTYARIAPRSSLAAQEHIDVGAGVVDRDYRGNVQVVLFNHGSAEFVVEKGDRIAQLICERIAYPEVQQCETLPCTHRGTDGFGSTGRQ